MKKTLFKTCSMCRHEWPDRNSFISDQTTRIIGYQVGLESAEHGIFLFNHATSNCGTTMAVEVSEFTDMYDGPRFADAPPMDVLNGCPGLCMHEERLDPCTKPGKCSCAYVRVVLQTLMSWPKRKI